MSKKSDADPYLVALRLLAGRDYTVAGLAQKLVGRGYAAPLVQHVVERLLAARLLDDRRYAERFIEAALGSGRYVGYRLRQELRRRGIASDLIVAVFAERQEPSDELAVARNLVERRYAGYDPASATDQQRRRIAGFLQRRGFGSDTVWRLLERHVGSD